MGTRFRGWPEQAYPVLLELAGEPSRETRERVRRTEQLSYTFALIDLLPYGRQEEWQDSPEGWPQSPAYSRWASSEDIAGLYGPDA